MFDRYKTAIAVLVLLSLPAAAQDFGSGRPSLPLMPIPTGGVTGFVTSVTGNLITVLGGNIAIDTTGAVFHNRRGPATIADVKPGMQIVAAIRNPQAQPGTVLQAASVLILDSPAGSLNGPVQSVDVAGSALTIFGARVLVTPNTRIFGMSFGRTFTLADIKPGDTVAVEVNVNGSALTAETIYVFPPLPNAAFEGTVKSIGTTSWVITTRNGDVTVTVNAQTRIDSGVKVGDVVNVIGTSDAAGHITAISIIGTRLPEPALEGVVKSMGATSWVITARDQKDVTVTVNQDTRIDPSIKVGDSVLILVRRDASGNLIAMVIAKDTRRRSTGR